MKSAASPTLQIYFSIAYCFNFWFSVTIEEYHAVFEPKCIECWMMKMMTLYCKNWLKAFTNPSKFRRAWRIIYRTEDKYILV